MFWTCVLHGQSECDKVKFEVTHLNSYYDHGIDKFPDKKKLLETHFWSRHLPSNYVENPNKEGPIIIYLKLLI